MKIPDGFLFHHIGYATCSIDRENGFFGLLGYRPEGNDFTDEVQGVKGRFLVGAGPRIELLENLCDSNTLTPWLNAGIKFYHFAYCVPSMDEALFWAKNLKARVTVPPVPAIAFEGREISFIMFRNGMLLEFIQR